MRWSKIRRGSFNAGVQMGRAVILHQFSRLVSGIGTQKYFCPVALCCNATCHKHLRHLKYLAAEENLLKIHIVNWL